MAEINQPVGEVCTEGCVKPPVREVEAAYSMHPSTGACEYEEMSGVPFSWARFEWTARGSKERAWGSRQ